MSYFFVFRNTDFLWPSLEHNDGKSLIIPIRECQLYVQNMVSHFWQINEFVYTLSDPFGGEQCDEIIERTNNDFYLKSICYSNTYFFKIISLLIAKKSDIIFWYGSNSLERIFYISYDLFQDAVIEYISGNNSDYNSSILITGKSTSCANTLPETDDGQNKE